MWAFGVLMFNILTGKPLKLRGEHNITIYQVHERVKANCNGLLCDLLIALLQQEP